MNFRHHSNREDAMHRDSTHSIRFSRIALAAGLFMAALIIFLWWSYGPGIPVPQENLAQRETAPGLFYQQIGTTPRDFEQRVGKDPEITQYTIELGRKKSPVEAEKWVEELQNMGLDAFYTPLHIRGKVFYRVRLGIFPSEAQAQSVAQKLHQEKNMSGTISKL